MRTFEHFPDTAICPICNTSKQEACCLVPIDGTEKPDSTIMQALPVHVACIIECVRYNAEVNGFYVVGNRGFRWPKEVAKRKGRT